MRAKEHSSIFFQNLNATDIGEPGEPDELGEPGKRGEPGEKEGLLSRRGGVLLSCSKLRIDSKSCSFVSSNAVRACISYISRILLSVHIKAVLPDLSTAPVPWSASTRILAICR